MPLIKVFCFSMRIEIFLLILFSVQSTLSRQEGSSHTTPQAANITSDVLSDHDDDIVAVVQVTGFFKRVQSWASTIEKICNTREKQLLYLELFGEKPVCIHLW